MKNFVVEDVEIKTDPQPFDIEREGSLVILLEVDLSTEEATIKMVEDDNCREDQPLLSQLMSGCSPETSLMTRPPVAGQLVAALSSSGLYIRAKVEEVNLKTLQAHCKYVDDVGERMVRHFSSLSVLPESCLSVPLLTRTVKLFHNSLVSPSLTFMIGRKFLAREVTSATSSTSLPLVELTKPVQKSFHWWTQFQRWTHI